MQTEEVKSRFGRCPYCRAMIYQDLSAIIFYCSKCRTPIRGKNPQPIDETEYALAQLEILSADTASVFSDDVEPPNPRSAWAIDDDDGGRPPLQSRSATGRSSVPSRQGIGAASSSSYREFGSVRTGPRSSGGALSSGLNRDHQTEAARSASPLHSRVTQLRPSSRRTRRSSSGDVDVRSSDAGSGTESDSDAHATATSYYTRRSSPLSSQELDVATALSGFEPADLTRTPLSDPAFQKDLLQALDNLRKLIAAVDHPLSALAGRDASAERVLQRRERRQAYDNEAQLPPHAPPRVAAHAGVARRAPAPRRQHFVLHFGVEQPARWCQGAGAPMPPGAGRHAVRCLRRVLGGTAAAARPARRQSLQAAVRRLRRSVRADAAGDRLDGPAQENLFSAAACCLRRRGRRGVSARERQPERRAATGGGAAAPRAGVQLR